MSERQRFLREFVDLEELEWQADAKCASDGGLTALFYPEVSNAEVSYAKSICKGTAKDYPGVCPVIMECLHYAVTHDEKFGVWGGTSERERRRLRAAARLAAIKAKASVDAEA
jgi:WhiB family redox-sensing transcriptional regulator